MSRARQGGLRPNRRHVQRGSGMISFVLDVAGKTQSSLPIPLHLSFRADGEGALFAAMVSGATSMRTMPNTARHRRTSLKGTKCAIALVAQSDSERWSTEPEVAGSNPAEGTRNRKLLRYLSSASCSSCVGSLTAESRSPKPWDAGSRPARRAKTVLLGSFLTHGFSQVKRYRPNGSGLLFRNFPYFLSEPSSINAPLAELVDALGSNPSSLRSEGSIPSWGTSRE